MKKPIELLEAGEQFRKIIGSADFAKLALAVERDLTARRPSMPVPATAQEADALVTIS